MVDADTSVTLQPLVATDLPGLATLTIANMRHDEMSTFLWPHLDSYLESFRIYLLVKFKQQYNASDTCMFVAKVDGIAVGYSAWKRIGAKHRDSWIGQRKSTSSSCMFSIQSCGQFNRWSKVYIDADIHTWLLTDIETCLLKLEEMYKGTLCVLRGAPYTRQRDYNAYRKQRQDPFNKITERWWLDGLAIDPAYQRRGIGSKLMEWGMERSKEEGIPITLDASSAGLRLYQKLGFREAQLNVIVDGIKERSMVWSPHEHGPSTLGTS